MLTKLPSLPNKKFALYSDTCIANKENYKTDIDNSLLRKYGRIRNIRWSLGKEKTVLALNVLISTNKNNENNGTILENIIIRFKRKAGRKIKNKSKNNNKSNAEVNEGIILETWRNTSN